MLNRRYQLAPRQDIRRLGGEKPKIICIVELDKMFRQYQNQCLNFLESGRIKVDQMRRQYDFSGAKFSLQPTILAGYQPLQSRFRRFFLPRYTEEQFLDVSEKVLPKISPSIVRYIAANVWKNGGDIRDCILIGKLVRKNDGPEEIAEIAGAIIKYGREGDEQH